MKCVFDNEQVIGKTRLIQAENKVPTSVITSHAYLQIDAESNDEKSIALCPRVWFFKPRIENNLKQLVLKSNDEEIAFFRKTRNIFIEERIRSVSKDQEYCEKNKTFQDFVDKMIELKNETQREKVCLTCGAVNGANRYKCRNAPCDGSLATQEPDYSIILKKLESLDLYKIFESEVHIKKNNISVAAGEPDLLNPNSYENISQILRNLATRVGISRYGTGRRQWIILEVDGTIFCIVEQLIFNTLYCPLCKTSFYGNEEFQKHGCTDITYVEPEHEFDWIILQPGLLHTEMNSCKAFIGLNWEILLEIYFQP